MKAELSASKMEVWMILPAIVLVYDSEVKTLEAGFYFLNFSLTLKISNK